MELAGVYISLFYKDVGSIRIIAGPEHNAGVVCFGIIRMHKIEIGIRADSAKERIIAFYCDIVPSDLRDLVSRTVRKPHYPAGKKTESGDPGALFAAFE